jgi:nucleotide-binding universal stress UspA family protein
MHSIVSAPQVKPVAVGIDGSPHHLVTIDLAVTEAIRRGAPLHIMHVTPGRYVGLRSRATAPQRDLEGRRLLDIAARRAEHRAPGLQVSTELVDGAASMALVERSAATQLLVIGHRDDLPGRPSWGSTAAYVAHQSVCPLLVHRGAAPDHGPVVLAASARTPATATVTCAYEEALRSGSPLLAVHVWNRPAAVDMTAPRAASRGSAADRRRAEQRLERALGHAARSYPGVAVERLVLRDLDIAYTLERVARRGDLLVVGMGRDRRSAELLYGSLGVALLRQAACPVLLVPHDWRVPFVADIDGRPAAEGPAREGRSALTDRRRRT